MSVKQRTVEPSLNDTLDAFKVELFRDLYVMRPGEIQSYDPATASATVKLKVKEWTDYTGGKSQALPLLADVPVFILQGGGSWIEFPIAKGDPCLVFFSDRDIDTWWTSGNETTPNSLRKHDLSDCIAVVGVNPKSNPLALTGKTRLFSGPHKLDLVNNAQALSSLVASLMSNVDDLFTQVNGLITELQSLVTVGSATTQTVAGGPSVAVLIARAASFATIKGQFDTLKTNFTQLLGASS